MAFCAKGGVVKEMPVCTVRVKVTWAGEQEIGAPEGSFYDTNLITQTAPHARA